jgi:hypothetical protein
MKTPRFTIRKLMFLVAFSTLPAWGYTLWKRSTVFAEKAEAHQLRLGQVSWNAFQSYWGYEEPPTVSEQAGTEYWRRILGYHEHMYYKYRRAALCPWLPIDLDPTPPSGF